MDSKNLAALLSSKYNRENWKGFLSQLFPKKDFFITPEDLVDPTINKHSDVAHIYSFGETELNNRARIQFFEIELKDGKSVTRNRVGLRNIISSDVIPGYLDGILAVYYNPNARDWRFTFISKSLMWDEEAKEIKSETQPKRYTYVLGETEGIKTARKQFDWLLKEADSKERLDIEDLVKAFSIEKLSNEFFDGYKVNLNKFEEFITSHTSMYKKFEELVPIKGSGSEIEKETNRLISNFCKKLLGRIVFLYFLQKKGWLGVDPKQSWGEGQRDFLSNLYSGFSSKDNFYPNCLVPLFFDTLNRSRKDDIFTITNTKIPYLNGGLFDKDPNEITDIKFPPVLFEELFQFFDQYNFTIDENSPDDFDIGIDPEMLGLIFENLLEDNREKGTFYTPKEVVHYMCKESLSLYLQDCVKDIVEKNVLKQIDYLVKQTESVNLSLIEKHSNEISKALDCVKICDPAIGSGAFPMGMVYELLRLKKLVGSFTNRSFDYRKEKLKILKNSIYGVDIDKGAVDIARLRFWLSLIVDEEEPLPLPNLDYKIMQGDSLKEYFEGIPLNKNVWNLNVKFYEEKQLTLGGELEHTENELDFTIDQRKELKEWVNSYFEQNDREQKEDIHKKIDKTVLDHIEKNIELEEDKYQIQKDDIEQKNPKIKKGQKAFADKEWKKVKPFYNNWANAVKKLEELKKKRDILKKLQNSVERPYFLWNLFFSDVLDEGNEGFDIVIGNPPYGVKVDDEVRKEFDIVSKDSYGAFMSMALKKLVKESGVISFIVSDTWLTIKSHFNIRRQYLDKQLLKVMRLHQDCFQATVNSCILILRNEYCSEETTVIAADLTNISTRKEIPEFRKKLFNLEKNVGRYTPKFAVYKYPQTLLSINSNKPVIVGSPKLFQLMNDSTIETDVITDFSSEIKELSVRKLKINTDEVRLIRFGDISEVRDGMTTGDNEYYLFKNISARGSYKHIESYKNFVLTKEDLGLLNSKPERRNKVIAYGFHKNKNEKNFDEDRWFNGRYIAPYDKGGESDTDDGWLPNYFVPSEYYIDWSCDSVNRMRSLTIKDRILLYKENKPIRPHYHKTLAAVIRNSRYYFTEGLTYSRTGIYSPTFRINSNGVYDVKGAYINTSKDNFECLGILCSKMIKYLSKIYIYHVIDLQVDAMKEIPIFYNTNVEIRNLSLNIIEKQKINSKYDYMSNEQVEIDKLIYQEFALDNNDINEIETWYARRYPKLAKYAYYKPQEELEKEEAEKLTETAYINKLIEDGENKTVEFKSTLRFCLKEKSPQKYIEHSTFKNIAAFLNTNGGTILIGVDDDGNILGLEDTDFKTFKDSNKVDALLKHFDNLLQNYFGNSYNHYIELKSHSINSKTILEVKVKERAAKPVFLVNKEKNIEEFYIRRNASATPLTMREFYEYEKVHWGNNEIAE